MPADFPMQATHAIHRPAPPDCQIGHVETLRRVVRILAAQGQQIVKCNAKFLLCILSEVLFDESRSEKIKAGGHWRVCSEKIPRSRNGKCNFEGQPGFFHETSRPLQHSEGRMPFIQVTDFRLDAQCAEQPPAANPEKQFLLDAQLRAAPIQLAGDPSMSGEVRRGGSDQGNEMPESMRITFSPQITYLQLAALSRWAFLRQIHGHTESLPGAGGTCRTEFTCEG